MSSLSELMAAQARLRRALLDPKEIARRRSKGAERATTRHESHVQLYGSQSGPEPPPPHKTTPAEKRRYRRERRGSE